jgi:hypothetical protein
LLPMDRSGRLKGTIVRKEFLQELRMHHLFMQGARVPIRFLSFFPATILVLKTQVPTDRIGQFDFMDDPLHMGIAIRMGPVALIGCLQDGGAVDLINAPKYRKVALHPIQFKELVAQVFYKASLMNRVPKFMLLEDEEGLGVFQLPLGGLSSKPIFDDWQQSRYVQILSQFTRVPMTELPHNDTQVWTWLRGEDKKLLFIDVNKKPII